MILALSDFGRTWVVGKTSCRRVVSAERPDFRRIEESGRLRSVTEVANLSNVANRLGRAFALFREEEGTPPLRPSREPPRKRFSQRRQDRREPILKDENGLAAIDGCDSREDQLNERVTAEALKKRSRHPVCPGLLRLFS